MFLVFLGHFSSVNIGTWLWEAKKYRFKQVLFPISSMSSQWITKIYCLACFSYVVFKWILTTILQPFCRNLDILNRELAFYFVECHSTDICLVPQDLPFWQERHISDVPSSVPESRPYMAQVCHTGGHVHFGHLVEVVSTRPLSSKVTIFFF